MHTMMLMMMMMMMMVDYDGDGKTLNADGQEDDDDDDDDDEDQEFVSHNFCIGLTRQLLVFTMASIEGTSTFVLLAMAKMKSENEQLRKGLGETVDTSTEAAGAAATPVHAYPEDGRTSLAVLQKLWKSPLVVCGMSEFGVDLEICKNLEKGKFSTPAMQIIEHLPEFAPPKRRCAFANMAVLEL